MNRTKVSADQGAETKAEEFSLISNGTLLALYRNLLKCRVGAAPAKGARRRTAAAWPFDAAVVAVAQDLGGEDAVLSLSPNRALQLLQQGPRRGGDRGGDSNRSILLQWALGDALINRTRKTGKVTVIFSSEDDAACLDTLETARVHRLPMVFVHSSDGQEQTAMPNAAKLEPGTELPHIVADGDDVVAIYRAAHESINRARRDRGPTLIECIPFRLPGRRRQDPIAGMENYLRGKGLLRSGLRNELLAEIARESVKRSRKRG